MTTVKGDLSNITGQSSGRLQIKDCRTGHVVEVFEVDDVPLANLDVKPLDEQSPWESRRAWNEVISGIFQGNTHS